MYIKTCSYYIYIFILRFTKKGKVIDGSIYSSNIRSSLPESQDNFGPN